MDKEELRRIYHSYHETDVSLAYIKNIWESVKEFTANDLTVTNKKELTFALGSMITVSIFAGDISLNNEKYDNLRKTIKHTSFCVDTHMYDGSANDKPILNVIVPFCDKTVEWNDLAAFIEVNFDPKKDLEEYEKTVVKEIVRAYLDRAGFFDKNVNFKEAAGCIYEPFYSAVGELRSVSKATFIVLNHKTIASHLVKNYPIISFPAEALDEANKINNPFAKIFSKNKDNDLELEF